jgi:hypothetical protein
MTSVRSEAAIHHLNKIEGFLRSSGALSGTKQQFVGRHHHAVEPLNSAAATDPANDADIGPVDLRNYVGNEKFLKSEQIGCTWHLFFWHSHFLSPPLHDGCRQETKSRPHDRRKLQSGIRYFFPAQPLVESILNCLVPAKELAT